MNLPTEQYWMVCRELVPASFVWFGEVCRWKLVNFRHWTLAGSPCPVRFRLRYAAPEVNPLMHCCPACSHL